MMAGRASEGSADPRPSGAWGPRGPDARRWSTGPETRHQQGERPSRPQLLLRTDPQGWAFLAVNPHILTDSSPPGAQEAAPLLALPQARDGHREVAWVTMGGAGIRTPAAGCEALPVPLAGDTERHWEDRDQDQPLRGHRALPAPTLPGHLLLGSPAVSEPLSNSVSDTHTTPSPDTHPSRPPSSSAPPVRPDRPSVCGVLSSPLSWP